MDAVLLALDAPPNPQIFTTTSPIRFLNVSMSKLEPSGQIEKTPVYVPETGSVKPRLSGLLVVRSRPPETAPVQAGCGQQPPGAAVRHEVCVAALRGLRQEEVAGQLRLNVGSKGGAGEEEDVEEEAVAASDDEEVEFSEDLQCREWEQRENTLSRDGNSVHTPRQELEVPLKNGHRGGSPWQPRKQPMKHPPLRCPRTSFSREAHAAAPSLRLVASSSKTSAKGSRKATMRAHTCAQHRAKALEIIHCCQALTCLLH